jgi:hypothetical protein
MTATLPFSTETLAFITSFLTKMARTQPRKGILVQIVPFLAFARVGSATYQLSNVTLRSCCNDSISCISIWEEGTDTY